MTKFIRHKWKVKRSWVKLQEERFRLISIYEGKVSDRMKWVVSGGCGLKNQPFFRNTHKD